MNTYTRKTTEPRSKAFKSNWLMEIHCSSFSSNLHVIATWDTCMMITMTDISSFAD
jgi:hypothetical protein